MYPANFFQLFPPFPREEVVFVAMSFAPEFDARWKVVLQPAIESVGVNSNKLRAHRVDVRRVSDSVITEILDGIGRCRLFVADISTIGHLNDRPVRNANVLYEVGLAHAVRLAEEVILFRSDHDELVFDVTNIRVNPYDPERDPDAAKELVAETIMASLRELELRRHLAVREAASMVGLPAWSILGESRLGEGVAHPKGTKLADTFVFLSRTEAIQRLLDLRAVSMEFVPIGAQTAEEFEKVGDVDFVRYRATEFGKAILDYGFERITTINPQIVTLLRPARPDPSGE